MQTDYELWLANKAFAKQEERVPPKLRYEFQNILERYLISRDNSIQTARQKLYNELHEKGINVTLKFPFHVPVSPSRLTETDTELIYGDFKLPLTRRVKALIKLSNTLDVMRSALRYAALLPRGQQWSIPANVAKKLFNDGFVNEGFASPFNSKFLPLGGKYYSLYPDVDTPLGSSGTFFTTNLVTVPGNWYLNPPWIESIMDRMVNQILAAMSADDTKTYFIVMADWSDTSAYLKLKPRAIHHTTMMKGTYNYETPEGEKIPAKFNTAVFVVGNPVGMSDEMFQDVIATWQS